MYGLVSIQVSSTTRTILHKGPFEHEISDVVVLLRWPGLSNNLPIALLGFRGIDNLREDIRNELFVLNARQFGGKVLAAVDEFNGRLHSGARVSHVPGS